MTTSGVVSFAFTRLPAWTMSDPVRPSSGERISQYDRCSRAVSAAARSAATTARAASAARFGFSCEHANAMNAIAIASFFIVTPIRCPLSPSSRCSQLSGGMRQLRQRQQVIGARLHFLCARVLQRGLRGEDVDDRADALAIARGGDVGRLLRAGEEVAARSDALLGRLNCS